MTFAQFWDIIYNEKLDVINRSYYVRIHKTHSNIPPVGISAVVQDYEKLMISDMMRDDLRIVNNGELE